MVKNILLTLWALFFGIAMISLANGLQGSLLGIRATIEQFGTAETGLIMSLYYIGFLLGSVYIREYVIGVGHIRVFAAMASLASITILAHSFLPYVWVWALIRVVTGFAYAGLYIVIESWLNNSAENNTRGQIISAYMIVNYLGLMGGQFMLNLSDPAQHDLFVLISVMVSFGLVPIALTKLPAPALETGTAIDMKKFFMLSPTGVFGIFMGGMAGAMILSLGAVYFAREGFDIADISKFMGLCILGGALMQGPLGRLSDRIDRHYVIAGAAAAAVVAALILFSLPSEPSALYFIMAFLFGGTGLTIYALSVAQLNDRMEPYQMVSASASVAFVFGLGSCFGPFVASFVMDIFGNGAYFMMLAVINLSIFLCTVYRFTVSDKIAAEDKTSYVSMPARVTPVSAETVEQEIIVDFVDREETKPD